MKHCGYAPPPLTCLHLLLNKSGWRHAGWKRMDKPPLQHPQIASLSCNKKKGILSYIGYKTFNFTSCPTRSCQTERVNITVPKRSIVGCLTTFWLVYFFLGGSISSELLHLWCLENYLGSLKAQVWQDQTGLFFLASSSAEQSCLHDGQIQ